MSGQAQDDVYLKLVMEAFDEHIPQFDISDRKYDAFKQSVADALHSALAEKDAEIARLSLELAAPKMGAAAAGAYYTESPPTEPGCYWFKHSKGDAELGVLLMDADGIGWLHGDDVAWRGGGPAGTLFGPMVVPPK